MLSATVAVVVATVVIIMVTTVKLCHGPMMKSFFMKEFARSVVYTVALSWWVCGAKNSQRISKFSSCRVIIGRHDTSDRTNEFRGCFTQSTTINHSVALHVLATLFPMQT
jgi:hypothetical protein